MQKRLIALCALVVPVAPAPAQALSCVVPQVLPVPRTSSAEGERRLVPVSGYTLALSWSPEYCAGGRRYRSNDIQCNGAIGQFGFILHGLWPDGQGNDWPQYCAKPIAVPEAVIRRTLCVTPSPELIQHEWEKHGSCMARTPEAYFAKSAALYRTLNFPDMPVLRRQALTVGRFAALFAAANRGMRAEQLQIRLNRKGWLEEVWLCLDTRFRPRTCPSRGRAASRVQLIRIAS